MARRSTWSEFLRAQEKQRQELARQQRQIDAAARRSDQAMRRAQRDAERKAKVDAREQERLTHEAAAAEAERLTDEVSARVDELKRVLAASRPATLSFAAMRREAKVPPFDARRFGGAVASPAWEQFAPGEPPRGLSAKFGGTTRYERDLAAARQAYEDAVDESRRAENERLTALRRAKAEHDQNVGQLKDEILRHNQQIDAFEAAFLAGDPDAVEDYVLQLLSESRYPIGFPDEKRIAYRAEPRELWVEAELPGRAIVPSERGFRYVKTRKTIDALPRPERELKPLYASVVAQVALRTLGEIFSAVKPELIDVVVFNGHVSTRDPATGKQIRPCLVSVSAKRSTFEELELEHLDPPSCLKYLNAIISPHPYDLVAVPPVVEFDLAKYKFVDEFDAAAELDGRSDLLEMDPFKFEHLIRQLFEGRGMKGWTTQGSRDDGVDAVAVDEDPIMGGVCVIQAKRYRKVVPTEAVRALWGTMEDKSATKGILVTTSWFGSAGRQFAARNRERLRLIEGPELKHLLEEHLGLKVRIGLDRQPPTR